MTRDSIAIMSRRLKTLLKDAYYLPLDTIESITGKRDEFTPPRRYIFVGDRDFRKMGEEFFGYFVNLGGLKPEHRVLDVGCGIGRMAIPLMTFLTEGTYDGFDIIQRGINWSRKHISAKHPNFHFQLADVYNKWYNPGGSCAPSEYKFPFPDKSFDFVFLTSVFTHMLRAELENYFSEISRVLARDGTAFVTYFLMNSESGRQIQDNLSSLNFSHRGNGYWTVSEKKPEAAIAYDEAYVKGLYGKHGLEIVEPIHYGSWCGRGTYTSYQDIIIGRKV